MSFFEVPPPPPEPPEPAWKPWWQAPRNELGVSTGLRLLLARTEETAVAVLDAVAFSTGVELTLTVLRRTPGGHDPFDHPFSLFGHGARAGEQLPSDLLRFGVQFSDGRKATTLGSGVAAQSGDHGDDDDADPAGPLLSPGGGSGSDDRWDSQLWLWPLPPPGPLAFVVEWPAEEIELSRREVDASLFLDASRQAEELWP